MDLKTYDFEKPSIALNTDMRLLREAEDRGFYNGNTKYNKLFSDLFFNGGTLNFKQDLDDTFKDKSLPYLRSFMGSFSPKHEEKEAISAMLLSELVDEPK